MSQSIRALVAFLACFVGGAPYAWWVTKLEIRTGESLVIPATFVYVLASLIAVFIAAVGIR